MNIVQLIFNGRLGNQMLQYAVARKFAELSGCSFEYPEWIGEKIFAITPNRPTKQLMKGKNEELKVNTCLQGYYQHQDYISLLSRRELCQWFTFKTEWIERFPKPKIPYCAFHLRKGDYLTKYSSVYCNISEQSYSFAEKKYNIDLPIVWVREDKPQIDKELESKGLGFLPDWFTLINASVILRGNSTFSWWASVLSDGETYSPIVGDKIGPNDVEFVEGNWPMMVHPTRCGGKTGDLHLPK